jgi:hypothetical protein
LATAWTGFHLVTKREPCLLQFGVLGGHPKPAINRHLKTGN